MTCWWCARCLLPGGGSASRLKRRPLVAALAGAAVVAAALVAASLLGSSAGQAEPTAPRQALAAPVERDSLFRGIPQNGIALGSPQAPVTLVEYADLQCPYCAQWARDAFPTIVDEYVRAGRVRIVFRGLSFIGRGLGRRLEGRPRRGCSKTGSGTSCMGSSVQQGAENSGWVSDAVLRSFDGTGLDTQRMLDATHSAGVERQLAAAQRAATAAGVPATPSFLAGRTRSRVGAPGGRVAGARMPSGTSWTIFSRNERPRPAVDSCGAFAGGRRRCGVCPRRPAGRTLAYSARPVAARRFSAPPTPSSSACPWPHSGSLGTCSWERRRRSRSTCTFDGGRARAGSRSLQRLPARRSARGDRCRLRLVPRERRDLEPHRRRRARSSASAGLRPCRSGQSDLAALRRARSARAPRGFRDGASA